MERSNQHNIPSLCLLAGLLTLIQTTEHKSTTNFLQNKFFSLVCKLMEESYDVDQYAVLEEISSAMNGLTPSCCTCETMSC
ncbi:uncharacterized protein PHALS_13344 [Plasmopara halstedii]|uniref:Uncharacterized protein n=1 Tax=Plasmopara halstedii TaxID=4781 RepID=A0A0P1APR0_PLAHL|nr:uncharacterized protein PHALS_13344 [Plasmopara halstedii]CEG43127.1 hypothetical protein PHALS_13344 [Plasmopara halstedii]|eukprot:XP_024579496.1 hypothetical protein PHALS_13344 [Plasmopara halstedii]